MAGKSPGKSEQQKSSGEADRDSDRDPRDEVVRDSPAPGGEARDGVASVDGDAEAGSGSGSGAALADGTASTGSVRPEQPVDGATADGADFEPPDDTDRRETGEPTGPAASAPDKSDARLRAAVAAWVAGTEQTPDEGADPSGESRSAAGAEDVRHEPPAEGAAKSPSADEAATAPALPKRPVDRPTTAVRIRPQAQRKSAQDPAPAGTKKPSEDEEAARSDSRAGDAQGQATAFFGALRAKDKRPSADGSSTAGRTPADTGKSSAAETAGETADTDSSGGGDRRPNAGKAAKSADPAASSGGLRPQKKEAASADGPSAEAKQSPPEPKTSSAEGKSPADADKADGDADKDAATKPDGGETATPGVQAPAASHAQRKTGVKPAEGAPGGSGTGDARKPGAKKSEAPSAEERGRKEPGVAEGGEDARKGADETTAEGSGKGPAKKVAGVATPVDQPTAVFQSVRPADRESRDAKPSTAGTEAAVDQPTTTFKAVRPAATKKPDAADKPDAGKKPDAERPSRFVPLTPDDQAPRKPRPAAGAAGTSSAASAKSAAPASTEPSPPESERTKQEVLPPSSGTGDVAPLDLLAQLTNTPPPPETFLRTTLRRIKIWTPLVILLAIIFATVQALRPLPEPALGLTAKASYAFDGARPSIPWPAEGQAYLEVEGLGSLGSYGEQKPVPIASVAKVMTAYIVLRDHPVKKDTNGAMIPIDKQAADDARKGADGESVVEVTAGEEISEKEAIQAIMIASANNIARLLARWDAGSEEAFVKKMNDAAKDLGMRNTTYTDPSGLREQTVSTAVDQVKLGRKAMDDPLFREIVRLPDYADSKGANHFNWNKLVPVDGVVGIKTGTTTRAGGNLLFAAEKEIGGTRQLIIGATLGQYRAPIIDTVLAESKKLIDVAQDVLVARTVVKKGDVVGRVDDGLGGTTPVVATKDVTAIGWPGLTVRLAVTDGGKAVPHEAKAGTKVGTLTVGSGPGQVEVPVVLQKDLTEPGFSSKLVRIL